MGMVEMKCTKITNALQKVKRGTLQRAPTQRIPYMILPLDPYACLW